MNARYARCLTLLAFAALTAHTALAQCATGRIATTSPLRFNTLFACTADGLADETEIVFQYDVTTERAVLLVDESFNLVVAQPGSVVDLEGLPAARYFALGLTYEGDLLVQPGQNVYSVPLASGCARLSQNNIAVQSEAPEAGDVTLAGGARSATLCLEDDVPDVLGFDRAGAQDFNGYVYLVTDERGRVEAITGQGFYNFQFLGAGTSRVYGLAFNRGLRVAPGDFIGAGDLADGCYSLTDDFVTVERAVVDGGRVTVDGRERVTVDSARSQLLDVQRVSTSPEEVVYVLIDRQSVIVRLSPNPLVDLSCVDAGSYLLYAYSYTGQVLLNIGDRLWVPGNRFASGCFLSSDNAIVIDKTSVPNCQPACIAEAGTLTASTDTLMLTNSVAALEATQDGNAVVPAGYETLFLLVRGSDQTVTAASAAQPRFSVTSPGDYEVVALVAELDDAASPNFFDLSSVVFGTTTVDALRQDLTAGGRCASLSVPGARFYVEMPAQGPCLAFAGAAIATPDQVAIVNGTADLFAVPDGSANVPPGFELRYVLTTGFLFTIVDVADDPAFTVTEAGNYTIHPLVAEVTDPNSPDYIDLGAVVPGVTSALDLVLEAFDAGKCVDFDFFGAAITVTGGSAACTAFAGTTTAVEDTVDVQVGRAVQVEVVSDGNAVVPAGFEQDFLLADAAGAVLEFSAQPRFVVDELGAYRIHSWVGEFDDPASPDYVDLNTVLGGSARIADLVDFIDGAGLCGDLESAGTPIEVVRAAQPRREAAHVRLVGDMLLIESRATALSCALTDLTGRIYYTGQLTPLDGEAQLRVPAEMLGQPLVVGLREATGRVRSQLVLPKG